VGDNGTRIKLEIGKEPKVISGPQQSYESSKYEKSGKHQDDLRLKGKKMGQTCGSCCDPVLTGPQGAAPLSVKKLFAVEPDALDFNTGVALVDAQYGAGTAVTPTNPNGDIIVPSAVAHPIVVGKAAKAPGDNGVESIFFCSQPGKIFKWTNGNISLVGDISFYSNGNTRFVMPLGAPLNFPVKQYDERGLLGIAFHKDFQTNGRFFLYYSAADGLQPATPNPTGPPDTPCRPCTDPNATIPCNWDESVFDHSNVLEEWRYSNSNGFIQIARVRRLLNIKHPFFNHDSLDNLAYDSEIERLLMFTGDGGFRDGPFLLPQREEYFHGKAIAVDVNSPSWSGFNAFNPVARFAELPSTIRNLLDIQIKGVRNWSGMTIFTNPSDPMGPQLKLMGQPGQDAVESIYVLENLKTFDASCNRTIPKNIAWPAYEGSLPSTFNVICPGQTNAGDFTIMLGDFKALTNYQLAASLDTAHINPYAQYYHNDVRYPEGGGVTITGQKPYFGPISVLKNRFAITDWGLNSGVGFPNGAPNDGGLFWRVGMDSQYCSLHPMERVPFNYNWSQDFPDGTFPLATVGVGSNQHQITRPFFVGLTSNSANDNLFLLAFNQVGSKNVQGLGTVYQIISQ
jgi:hypothetical protein